MIGDVIEGGIVAAALNVAGSTDLIVLLDPERRPAGVLSWHPFTNIVRVTRGKDVVWRAALVPNETTGKCWLGVDWDHDDLRAWTYSYDCQLDPSTGEIVRSSFTK